VQWGTPPMAWAKPRIDKSLLRPKAWWYATAAIPLVLGVTAMAIFVLLAVKTSPDEPRPFNTPGGPTFQLKGGQDQTIFRQSNVEPGVTGPPDCTVRELGSERLVPLRASGDTRLTFGTDEYQAELDFTPPAAGFYRVDCRPLTRERREPLAVGKQPRIGLFVGLIFAAIGSIVLGILLGGGVVAFVTIRRHIHKRRLERQATGLP
jgi:hypothetical protein